MATLQINIKNNTNAGQLFAHVTGRNDQGIFILKADGSTPYHPPSPAQPQEKVSEDTAIAVGAPGETRTVTVPQMAGARIWFSKERPLTFLVNPGPAFVEPAPTNPSDPNYENDWGFCEFTFNQSELYVNISYVDFVSLPVALRLENEAGEIKNVPGLPADGLEQVCAKLLEQGNADNAGWDQLVIRSKENGGFLRALSPNSGAVLIPGLFKDYFRQYVDSVWDKYSQEDLTVNTQFTWGDFTGRVVDGTLKFGDVASFGKPSEKDIFSCDSGPFAHFEGVSQQQLNIGARISAALNRSTLLDNARQPEGEQVDQYYKQSVTNHYSRICHEVSLEGRGYAFAYDDVGASNGVDQSGFISDPKPKILTIGVGAPL